MCFKGTEKDANGEFQDVSISSVASLLSDLHLFIRASTSRCLLENAATVVARSDGVA